jgi:hypothetical protein
MKFKPTLLLASMVAAGAFVSAPAFADSHDAAAVNSSVAQMEAVMNHNQNNVKTSESDFTRDWFQKIHISGDMNVDASYSSHNYDTVGNEDNRVIRNNSATDLAVNNMDLFIDAPLCDWAVAHAGLVYEQDRTNTIAVPMVRDGHAFNVDEAYVSFHNFSSTPVYFNFGKQYVDFGTYDHHPMFASLTQLLSETRAPAATLGFVTADGFYASTYTFRGVGDTDDSGANKKTRINNYGFNAGYSGSQSGLTYDVGAGYLSNLADANYVSTHLRTTTVKSAVGAWNVHASLASGPFFGKLNYVAAMKKFGTTANQDADITYDDKGAKPWATDLDLGYKFLTQGHDSSVVLTYGRTGRASGDSTNNAGGLFLPKDRYQATYNVELFKQTHLGVGVLNDKDYSVGNGGSGKSTTAATVRVGVEFA